MYFKNMLTSLKGRDTMILVSQLAVSGHMKVTCLSSHLLRISNLLKPMILSKKSHRQQFLICALENLYWFVALKVGLLARKTVGKVELFHSESHLFLWDTSFWRTQRMLTLSWSVHYIFSCHLTFTGWLSSWKAFMSFLYVGNHMVWDKWKRANVSVVPLWHFWAHWCMKQ